jgi:hypothetical protein
MMAGKEFALQPNRIFARIEQMTASTGNGNALGASL